MANISIDFRTALPADHVQARLARLGSSLSREFGLKVVWSGNMAQVMGRVAIVDIQAVISILPGCVNVTAKDPGFMFRGTAESFLREKLGLYLNPATPIEALPA